MNFIVSVVLIILSVFFLHKRKKWITVVLLIASAGSSLIKDSLWFFELDSLTTVGLLIAVISLAVVYAFSTKDDKVNRRIELLVIAGLLWLSLFFGARSVNQAFDNSPEQIIETTAIDVVEFGKGRGEFILWNFGYNRNTKLTFEVSGKEYGIFVPTHSCENLSIGDNLVLGLKEGLLGIKHCYIIFDEQNNVAEELPETRTEGKYIITNTYSD